MNLAAEAAEAPKPYEIIQTTEDTAGVSLTMADDLNALTGPGVYTFAESSVPAGAPYHMGACCSVANSRE